MFTQEHTVYGEAHYHCPAHTIYCTYADESSHSATWLHMQYVKRKNTIGNNLNIVRLKQSHVYFMGCTSSFLQTVYSPWL